MQFDLTLCSPVLFLQTHVPSKAETFSVRLPDAVRTHVDELARLTKRSRSFIVQEAVSTYVQHRAGYMRELDEARKSAGSGNGHSGEQIFEWMKSWGTANELASPEPDIRLRAARKLVFTREGMRDLE